MMSFRPLLFAGLSFLCFLGMLPGCGRGGKHAASKNPLVLTPKLALEGLQTKSLYYNAVARPFLLQLRPELLAPDDRGTTSERSRSFGQAAINPKLFRQLDRQYRFETLLLVGDPSQYRPLLDHLLEASDWKLRAVDHTSVIFTRERAGTWSSKELEPLWKRLEDSPNAERALALAQLAGKLIAVRQAPAAKEMLELAEKTDRTVPEIFSTQGEYRMSLGDWTGAISSADKALQLDADCLPALGVKAQSLYARKRFAEAYHYSTQLVGKMPEEPGILFYHARIAHESRHYEAEVATLEKLIALAEKNGRLDPGYRVYLGQAYASAGDADRALAELQKALADPDLPKEQQKFAQETIATIRRNAEAAAKQ